MSKLITASLFAEWISAAAVVVVSAIVGSYAAHGMTPAQWLGAAAGIGGAIAWAVMVRCWPEAAVSQEG